MSVSIVERINNLPYLYRLARSWCNLDSVWDKEWHRDQEWHQTHFVSFLNLEGPTRGRQSGRR